MAVFVDFNYDSMIFYFENFIGRGHITQKRSRNAKLIMYLFEIMALQLKKTQILKIQ